MSHRPSGLWCDLCKCPIVNGDWWHVGITDKATGEKSMGHCCQECKDEYERKAATAPAETKGEK